MIPFIETFRVVIQKLDNAKIEYMVVGSIASMVYGEPRLTRDMDLVVDIESMQARKLEELFPVPEYYCPPREVLVDEIINRRQFNLLHVASGLKIDVVLLKRTEYDKTRFFRRREVDLWEGCKAWLASPEDIIIKKLEYFQQGGSEKHIRDIRGILANTEVDLKYIEDWIDKINLQKEWQIASH